MHAVASLSKGGIARGAKQAIGIKSLLSEYRGIYDIHTAGQIANASLNFIGTIGPMSIAQIRKTSSMHESMERQALSLKK